MVDSIVLVWNIEKPMVREIGKALRNFRRAPEILRCAQETPQWPGLTAAYLGLARLRYPFDLGLRQGERFHFEELTDLLAFWQVFLRRVYRVRPSDRIILDLGANIGIFTLYAARLAPRSRLFSFEPFPSTYQRLLQTIREHLLESRVTCLNLAVAGASGPRLMPSSPLPSQRRALAESRPSALDSVTQVDGTTIEAIFEENRLTEVDLCKIDIEGSEYEVLLSTASNVLARIRRIALEYHGDSAPYSRQQLFDHLQRSGFSIAWDICDAQGYGIAEMIHSH